jgi:hypothetical protein
MKSIKGKGLVSGYKAGADALARRGNKSPGVPKRMSSKTHVSVHAGPLKKVGSFKVAKDTLEPSTSPLPLPASTLALASAANDHVKIKSNRLLFPRPLQPQKKSK